MTIGMRYTENGSIRVEDEENGAAWIKSDITAEDLMLQRSHTPY